MFTGVYSVQLAWLRTLVWGIAALIVLVAHWRWWTEVKDTTTNTRGALVKEPLSQA
jgi:hypothetical protein